MRFSHVAAFSAMLVPAAVCASPINVTPKNLTLILSEHANARVAVNVASTHLVVSPATTCFTTKGTPDDILRVTALNTSQGGATSLTLDVRAQHPGRCEIIFSSDKDLSSVSVYVR